MTKRTIIKVNHTFPDNTTLVNTECISLVNMIIKESRQSVVSCGDSVHIPCKVKVNIFHRKDLCVTTTCSTTFNPHNRTKRWFTKGNHRFLTNFVQSVCKTNWHSWFPFTSWCWVDSCHQNQFSWLIVFDSIDFIKWQFCLIFSVEFQIVKADSNFFNYFCDWF